ncbi:hypothetical protein CWB96_05035 [Pseudoalteromonas citrea]|uniref:HTH LytTR-type domain-containing protein n=1 Tax=Pseudoalteromonas citrea TaxID=43655 RepID=A0A5S3XSN6_9GAMM|nr:LytTR family DNA-binding domain-containing protein [Pseudoalteromonas citrea]TMP44741.1 hypothetical protein CWB97_05900 [Pseudoalteromonas citrea]TMP61114.1 hypothetical protein CWB96_05035 [Pseudoalteromonas citrea]
MGSKKNVAPLLKHDHCISSIGWVMFMCLIFANCLINSIFIEHKSINLIDSITFPLQKWGIWLILTPFVLHMLQSRRKFSLSNSLFYCVLSLSTLSLSLTFSVALEVSQSDISISHSLFFIWPKHAAALLIVVLLWHLKQALFNKPNTPIKAQKNNQPSTKINTLRIEVDGLTHTLAHQDILFIQAAGNYMEVITQKRTYLTRATLKQLHNLLPKDDFVQCHRSYLVNLEYIEQLKNHPAGHATAYLKNSQVVPISKSQRATIRTLISSR